MRYGFLYMFIPAIAMLGQLSASTFAAAADDAYPEGAMQNMESKSKESAKQVTEDKKLKSSTPAEVKKDTKSNWDDKLETESKEKLKDMKKESPGLNVNPCNGDAPPSWCP